MLAIDRLGDFCNLTAQRLVQELQLSAVLKPACMFIEAQPNRKRSPSVVVCMGNTGKYWNTRSPTGVNAWESYGTF